MSTHRPKEPEINDPESPTNPTHLNDKTSEAPHAHAKPAEFDPGKTTAAKKRSNPKSASKSKSKSTRNPNTPAAMARREYEEFLKEGGGDEILTAPKEHEKVWPHWVKIFRDIFIPERGETEEQIEEAAILRIDPVAFAVDLLKRQIEGRAARRNLILALFIRMVAQQEKAEIRSTLGKLGPGPLRDFRYGHLAPLEQSAIYDGLHATLRGETPAIWKHVNIELFQRLRELTDESGNLLFPDAGKYLVVDGSEIEAQAPQTSKLSPAQRQRLAEQRPKARFGRKGRTVYKLVVVSCAVTNLPLMWKLAEGTAVERQVTLDVLYRLFKAIPDLPSEYLIGDKHYDQEASFSRELVFRWGLQPVFPRCRVAGKNHPYTQKSVTHPGIDGVPLCPSCGELMVYDGAENLITGEQRVEELKLAQEEGREPARWAIRGNWAPTNAKFRWRCNHRDERESCRKKIRIRIEDAANIYTYLPRAGTHQRRYERRALIIKRNLAESIFSALKASQTGAQSQMRARWADDIEVEHLIGARFVFHTARHLIHLNGDYEKVYAEAEELGVLSSYRDQLAQTHDEVKQQRIFKNHREATANPGAPRTWYASERQDGYNRELKLQAIRGDAYPADLAA